MPNMMFVFRLGWLACLALIALAIGFSSARGLGAPHPRGGPARLPPRAEAPDPCEILPTGDIASCR
ncbi:hypothetical protein M446_5232 [Methylobacterium sp. 4-46]|uniref:hypothetical protein n=1 Tax=unclassified Methylobacterium TaxID=2615210 RepID=UPI000165CAE5|nr:MULTISPECIES: hypothetical protein [Methylobacterium]ACA19556.1 hypothetical protein M446_5232 [Methylobacterium sp. 4-46]WFT78751.1 hypothetical protein QA634_26320 [Methylobacterium nodulans]